METDEILPTEVTGRSAVFVRHACKNDLPELEKIEKERFEGDRISRRQFSYYLKQYSAKLIVAEYEQKLVGYALLLLRKSSEDARLFSIASALQQGVRGAGTMLLREVLQISKDAKRKRLILEVRKDNTYAITFYRKAGFNEFGIYPHYYEDGEDAIRMEKLL
jgi:ribosomal-protein-alanine acetyltransferase